jgi:hypothetical protein
LEKHQRQNRRVYTFLVVMWLLIAQRLQPLSSVTGEEVGLNSST